DAEHEAGADGDAARGRAATADFLLFAARGVLLSAERAHEQDRADHDRDRAGDAEAARDELLGVVALHRLRVADEARAAAHVVAQARNRDRLRGAHAIQRDAVVAGLALD